MRPLITIVTVCFNSEKTIGRTIKSVLEQDISEAEYIIVDGASKDGTLNIIEEYKGLFGDSLRIISEPDNGWYDAMNKGVLNSKGDFIVFINSDDYFEKDAIRTVVDFIKINNILDDAIVYGDSTNIYMNSKGTTLLRRIKAPDKITINDKALRDGMCGIRHQSMFTGRKVFETVGLLNLKYRLHADWDFLIKCIRNKISMYHIKQNLTYYSMYGASTKPNYRERHLLRKDNNLYNWIDLNCLQDRWGLKVIIKSVLGGNKWNDFLFWVHSVRNH